MADHGNDARQLLRDLPKIDDLLNNPDLTGRRVPRWALLEAARIEVEHRRQEILAGRSTQTHVSADEIFARASDVMRPSLQRVINATGVVLHTNLGRAPLPAEAIARAAEVASGYSNLEYDVGHRGRGSRHDHIQALVAKLAGAEASVVVNNNAAAVLLCLAAMAADKEVVVSRGELVEIGGSFRIPDVMRWSGARLVEVGTTNKTHARDYREATGENTGLLLKVHQSNFAVVGFTSEVSTQELVAIGQEAGVPVAVDLGSGSLVDLATLGDCILPAEPTVGDTVAAGADLVMFSGDKLLGGPQAGIIVGTQDAVARVRKHPLMRVVRPDKLTLAALEATLELYRGGHEKTRVPTLRMLAQGPAELKEKADVLRGLMGTQLASLAATVVEVHSAVGGGAMPTAQMASFAVAITASDGRSANDLDDALRGHRPPIVGRIADDRLLFDVRTLADGDLGLVADAIKREAE